MSRRTEIGTTGIFRERRSREAYLTMPKGQDARLTLYRENVIEDTTQDPPTVSAARDDDPIIRTASQMAKQEVTVDDPLHPGTNVTVSGAVVMAALAEFFDQMDEARIEERRAVAEAERERLAAQEKVT